MERRKDNKGRVLNKGESQRKDGSYMYRYYNLNKERKTVYATTLNELRNKEADIERDLMDGITTTDMTLNQAFDKYLKQKTKVKPRILHKYEARYNNLVRNSWLGEKKISKLVKSDIVRFYKEIAEEGYSNGTIQEIHNFISGVLEMAYEDSLIRRNFAKGCSEPYREYVPRKALTKRETDLFLTACENYKFGRKYLAGFKLMLLTGLRIGELTGLTWNDIDLEKRIIDVNHQLVIGDEKGGSVEHIDVPKTKKGVRKVPMCEEVYELLKELKSKYYKESEESGVEIDGYKGFVFSTKLGHPIRTQRFNSYAYKIVDDYNKTHDEKLPHITCHICRHTFCTRMAELNMNPNALIKIVGHSSYKVTEDIYVSVEDDFVNDEFFRVMRGK